MQEDTLPDLNALVSEAVRRLDHSGYLGIIYIDLEPLNPIEAGYGRDAFETVVMGVATGLASLRRKTIRENDLLCRIRPYGEQFCIFLEPARTNRSPAPGAIDEMAERLWTALMPIVAGLAEPFKIRSRVRIGYALALRNSMVQSERIVYRAIDQAAKVAESHVLRTDTRSRERLRDIIVRRQLTSYFQPIVELPGVELRAYEALIRGPPQSDLFSPAMLFNLANHAELVLELDRACSETTLAAAANLPASALLFANVLPTLINDESFRRMLLKHAEQMGRGRIVLELNESVAIHNYALLAHGLKHLRQEGILLAVDDLGAGHSNLDQILRLEPDFMKLDLSLVRGIHASPIKQALVSSMVMVGAAAGAKVIAEGIEEAAEYETVTALGVSWGQGYLFGRPANEFASPIPVRT